MNTVVAPPHVPMSISDLEKGFQILARLPLANAQQAETEMHSFLDALLQTPPSAEVYLQLLEQSRISLCFIEEDLARRYTDKPLPLGNTEEIAFQQVISTWRKAARAYAHCASLQVQSGDADEAERLALILHRCIHYTGMVVVEHHRARRQLPAGLWLDLHGYFASAEEWGVATVPVHDPLDPLGRSTHCTAALIALLLTELASPYSLSVRELSLVRRWANSWAPLVGIHPAIPGEPLPNYVVDLMQDTGLCTSADCLQTENLRRLDTSRLALQLNQTRQLLQQRVSPAQLGLGEDCASSQCQRLLKQLQRPWTLVHASRQFRRHRSGGIARVCSGFAAMHYYISGKEFRQPDSACVYTRQDFDSLFAFRHMVDPTQQPTICANNTGFLIDEWEVLDQSANGFRLMRSTAGRKVESGQLLALCPHDSNTFLLAQIAWGRQEQNGALVTGIAALPGKPEAIAVRSISQDGGLKEPFSRAFLLPPVPVIDTEATLVLPLGWFQPQRVLEVFADKRWQARLQRVLSEGSDFERVTFSVV